MDNAKIYNSPWKLSITAFAVPKEQAMTRAVHRFKAILILLNLKGKHVFLVVLPMPASLPEFGIHVSSTPDEGSPLGYCKYGPVREEET